MYLIVVLLAARIYRIPGYALMIPKNKKRNDVLSHKNLIIDAGALYFLQIALFSMALAREAFVL